MSDTSPLPSCEDFVVETIRTVRIKRHNQAPNTASGAEVQRIWKVVSEFYSEDDFRAAVKTLLADGRLVGWYRVYLGPVRRTSKRKFLEFAEDWDLTKSPYGHYYKDTDEERVGNAQLHVTEDGLGETVRKITGTNSPTAAAILQKLKG